MVGFVLVDKPAGPTSHDVVDAVRRALGIRRCGHAGTLDPPATGLVVVGVGAATRLLRFVQRGDKTYETTGVLGVTTTTLDASGDVTAEAPVDVDEQRLRAALDLFRGDIEQVPPAVSAVKVAGERAYRRAARGERVELEARPVTIHELELVAFEPPSFTLRVRCSTGTYVRTLVADVGAALGCGAHVADLRRTALGVLPVAEGVGPDEVSAEHVRSVEDVLRDLEVVRVDADVAARARHGQRVPAPDEASPSAEVLLAGPSGAVGVFERRDGLLAPVTVLPDPAAGGSP